jgi:ferredoxin-NADP reductase
MSTLFHDLRVKSIEPDTAEASILSFEVPPELRETFGFTQGQYLTLRANIDGQDLRRSYSICAGVDDGELRVGVRRVKGGAFSNWINESVARATGSASWRRRAASSCPSSRPQNATTSASPAAAASRRYSRS